MTNKERLIELIDDFGDDVSLCDVCSRPREDCEGCTNEQLAEYLVQNGVIVPPVKIGQAVYYLLDRFIEPCTIKIIFLGNYTDKDGNYSYMAEIHFDREDCPYVTTEIYFTDIGKTVFLTKEEAEKALKGGEGDG